VSFDDREKVDMKSGGTLNGIDTPLSPFMEIRISLKVLWQLSYVTLTSLRKIWIRYEAILSPKSGCIALMKLLHFPFAACHAFGSQLRLTAITGCARWSAGAGLQTRTSRLKPRP
jgi:hypothetical protein